MAQLLTANPPRPRPFYLSTEDLDRALDDPALAQLAASGWRPVVAVPVQLPGPNGPTTKMLLVLWPPETHLEPASANGWRWPTIVPYLLALIACCAAFAAGVML